MQEKKFSIHLHKIFAAKYLHNISFLLFFRKHHAAETKSSLPFIYVKCKINKRIYKVKHGSKKWIDFCTLSMRSYLPTVLSTLVILQLSLQYLSNFEVKERFLRVSNFQLNSALHFEDVSPFFRPPKIFSMTSSTNCPKNKRTVSQPIAKVCFATYVS